MRSVALCHLLIGLCFGLIVAKRRRAAAITLCGIGFGGLGAAWGRHTEQEQQWLHLQGGMHQPDTDTVICIAKHLPFAVAGIYFALRGREGRKDGLVDRSHLAG